MAWCSVACATRLAQADVPEPFYKDIVGHERQGAAQLVYNKSGHTLAQMKDAIERFEVLGMNIDLSRFRAALSARLSQLSFKSDRAFPA